MRYYLRGGTLFLRGKFHAASTGVQGGIRDVSTILFHTVRGDFDHREPARELERIAASAGVGQEYFGLLTAVDMRNLCILQHDFVTVFITAGLSSPAKPGHQTINILIHSDEGLTDGALLGAIIPATEAKAVALREAGFEATGTPSDAVCVACEGDPVHEYGGIATPVGSRVFKAVMFGIPAAMDRHVGRVSRDRPSFFVFSRFGGDHWVEWQPEGCPYYPCHFEGQSCEYCYCPFYPCKEPSLGQWVESSSRNGQVWNCSGCRLLHDPAVAEYLRRNPEATLNEITAFCKRKEGSP